jgi:Tfp pilus assembly protein PilZ
MQGRPGVKIKNDQRIDQRLMYEAVIWHDNILPGRFYMAKIGNISHKGLYFESDQVLYPGEKIYIDTKGPESENNISNNPTEIEIKWSKALKDSSYPFGYGAKLLDPNNPLVQSIGKSKTMSRNSQRTGGGHKRDPRQHARLLYGKEIIFTAKNRQHNGVMSNISRGGAFITTNYKFALGQLILIDIREDITHKARWLKGWVVRLSPNGVGVKFNRKIDSNRKKIGNRRNRTRPYRKNA